MAKGKLHNDSTANGSTNDQYLVNLAELETAFETPVVPGELDAWIETVDTATKTIAGQLKKQLRVVHKQQFDDIAEQDDELLGRLEQLREEDSEILTDFGKLSSTVGRFRETVVTADRNETELEKAQSNLAEQGVAFVVRARTQETAISTWSSEAFLRDHGVGD